MQTIQTTKSFFCRACDKLGINQKFHSYSPSEIDHSKNAFTSPVDGTIAYTGNISNEGEFVSKGGKIANLGKLIGDDALIFANYQYLNIYLSPKNRHFFTMPYDGTITKTYPNDGTAICPIFIGIENFLKLEVFHKAILENATHTALINTFHGDIGFIAVGSLNVNHIALEYRENETMKKGELFGHFSLGSSVILLIPPTWKILVDAKEKVCIGKRIVEIV